ncbi:hypothetical protein V5N11_016905 [Cardamine amara subsp. amara]|uniref:RNA helicase aquarius N-terminal domain-containing protein n=1 Tax=Cardamine amara subsp. amara TaxID=228776 RepID=A0ABD0Z3E9_CARAN
MILEVSQYLENYLWPNFDPETATFEHVMSMILMINEKFRENVAAWICFHDRDEVVVFSFEKQLFQKEAINALPLYPNEQIMWDKSVIPSINYSGEGCLALPKLNLQFLTLHDYLLRNFNLFRLESTYEIHEDIHEVVPRLLAHINNEGETAFLGWS